MTLGPGTAVATVPARATLDLRLRNTATAPSRAGPWQVTLQRYERPWQPGAAPRADAVAVALYLNAGNRTQVGWQSRPLGFMDGGTTWQDDMAAAARRPSQMALRSSDPLSDLRLGALAKYSFGSQSSISLRPRKGGVRLYLQAQW